MQPWNKAHELLSAAQGMAQSSAQWINTPLKIFGYHFHTVGLITRESMD